MFLISDEEYRALYALADAVRNRFASLSEWVEYPEGLLPDEFQALGVLDSLTLGSAKAYQHYCSRCGVTQRHRLAGKGDLRCVPCGLRHSSE